MFYTDKLEELAQAAVDGHSPCLQEDMGHEILGLIEVINAPKKVFDATLFGNVTLLDVLYEGHQLSPHTEKLTISIGAGGMTREIKIHAGHGIALIDLIQDAIPED